MIVCELPLVSRVFYRGLAPLLAGGALLSVAVILAWDFSATTAPWLGSWIVRIPLALVLLGFAVFLASRISGINASVRIEGKELHVRRFWSGRVCVHPLSGIASAAPGGILLQDGTRIALEGRAGPGLEILAQRP